MSETSTEEKTLSGYLLVDWKREDIRWRKTKPAAGDTSPYELTIPVTIEVAVPEVPTPAIEKRVEVPQAVVRDAETDDVVAEFEEGADE